MTTGKRVSMKRGALRNHQNTGNVLGSGMTNVSLGSDTLPSRAGVPGVHSWSRRLRRGVNIASLRCTQAAKCIVMTAGKRSLHDVGALCGREDTGNGLGSTMANVSLGWDEPARRAGVPGVHSWSRKLDAGLNIPSLRCTRTSKISENA